MNANDYGKAEIVFICMKNCSLSYKYDNVNKIKIVSNHLVSTGPLVYKITYYSLLSQMHSNIDSYVICYDLFVSPTKSHVPKLCTLLQ